MRCVRWPTAEGEAEPKLKALAGGVLKKTHGNPFYVQQLLRSMYDLGLFTFDVPSNRWTWVSLNWGDFSCSTERVCVVCALGRRLVCQGASR